MSIGSTDEDVASDLKGLLFGHGLVRLVDVISIEGEGGIRRPLMDRS